MKECPTCALCLEDAHHVCPADASPLEATLPGSPVLDSKYLLEARLGRGGMGVVYRGRHVALQRPLAVKLIRAASTQDERFVARFAREAEALGRLKHPHVVDVSDYGVDRRAGGVPYLVMELLEGRSLAERCGGAGPLLPVMEALLVLEDVARGVDFAHRNGILHRDLKPANVFLASTVEGSRAKLLDFGIARPVPNGAAGVRRTQEAGAASSRLDEHGRGGDGPASSDATETLAPSPGHEDDIHGTEIVGTPGFMAPELLEGRAPSVASDVYALGVTAFQLLTGRRPEPGRSRASTLRAELGPAVDDALAGMLADDPAARPASAGQAIAALRHAWQRTEASAWRRREVPRRAVIATALGVAAALSSAWWDARPVSAVERATVDLRFRTALAPRRPDPRLALVALDEDTLRADPRPLTARAAEFAEGVDLLLASGAQAVALDLVLPPTWAASPEFTRAVVRHAGRLTLAAVADADGAVIGLESAAGWITAALGPGRAGDLFAITNVDQDPDGVVRTARTAFRERDGGLRPAWAARAARSIGGGGASPEARRYWLDPAMDWRALPRVSWKDVPQRARAGAFAGKLVMVGGTFAGSGDEVHRLPSGVVDGVTLQAVAAHTILAGYPLRDVARWPVVLAASLLAAASAALLLCLPRTAIGWATLAAGLVLHVTIAFAALRGAGWIVPMAGPIMATFVAAAIAVGLRGRLLPPPVRAEAG